MSYNILPKNNNIIVLEPVISNSKYEIYNSISFFNMYKKKIDDKKLAIDTNNITNEIENIIDDINTQNFFLYNKIRNDNILYDVNDISNLQHSPPSSSDTGVFFDLVEIIYNMNLQDTIKQTQARLFITKLKIDMDNFIIFYNLNQKDSNSDKLNNNFYFFNLKNVKLENNPKVDFCLIELTKVDDIQKTKSYVDELLRCLCIIKTYLSIGGLFIIKMEHIFYKPVVEFIFILSCIFDKIYVIKPTTSSPTNFDKYIICKGYCDNCFFNKDTIYRNLQLLDKENDHKIMSFIKQDIPSYFINKITEIDVMLGQYQLDSIQDTINIINNKTLNDKIMVTTKNNIQKSVMWCNKHKVNLNNLL
jgi:hypothetical protein